mgnify:CR=1 FL=1
MTLHLKIHPESNDFDCVICCNESCPPPTEYNCNQCDKKICNDCYRTHIITSELCVFCRSKLNIPRYRARLSNFQRQRLYYYNALVRVMMVVFVWYTILLTYLYVISKYYPKKKH